jgi:hypothetical protein
MPRKFTQEEALRRFKKVHGNKYDYSLVQYINNQTKVIIICNEHGSFQQLPRNHFNGQNCPKCSNINVGLNARVCVINKKFNRLKVIEFSHINKDRSISYKCLCDCGNITTVRATLIIRGITKSCGCLQSEAASSFHLKDIRGEKFGRLLVLEKNGRANNREAIYSCICDCGKTKNVSSAKLRSGHTRSCGCLFKEQKRENHPNWNHSLTEEDRKNRDYSPEAREWRTKVYKRDNYTCQLSGRRGKKICAHHIESWNSNKERRFEVDNGITLRQDIHRLFHKYYGKGNNTREQFEEFCQRFKERS